MTITFGSPEAQAILAEDKIKETIEQESAKRVTCPRCNGYGDEVGFWEEEDGQDCFLCDGLGKIWKEEAERMELDELAQRERIALARWI